MSCSLQQLTAKIGMANISVANSNLDGTGSLGTVVTGASAGTYIKTITIKATGNVAQGMVRLFISGGGDSDLLFKEIQIPATVASSTVKTFGVKFFGGFCLQNGIALKASTQNSDTFIVTAEAVDWSNCGC